jgi:hypothetical protein
MSDAPTPSSEPTPADPTPAKATGESPAAPGSNSAPSARPPKKRRTWRQRILLSFIVLFLIVAIVRMLVGALLPVVLGRVFAFYNLSATYDRAELSVVDGNLNLYNLNVRPKEGGEPIAHADYIFGNIVPIELLHGRLHVLRVEVDGSDLDIDRNADGTIPLLARFASAGKPATTNTPAAPPKAVDLASPLKVEAFRLLRVTAHIHDQHVSPALNTDLQLSVRVSDLGVPGKSTIFEVSVAADQLLDELTLTGHAKAENDSLDAQMIVGIRGLHPKAAAGYLLPAGIQPAADTINMKMSAALTAAPSASTTGALTGKLTVENVSALADGQQSIGVDHVNVDIDSFDSLALKIADVSVQGVRVRTGRSKTGLLNACGIELVKAQNSHPTTTAPTTQPAAPAYAINVGSVQLRDCRLELDDQAVAPAAALAVQLDQLTIASSASGGPLAVVGKLSIPGVAKLVDLSGSASPFADTKTASLKLRVSGLTLTALKPYLDALDLESQYANGTFDCDLDANLKPRPDGEFSANAHLSKLRLANGAELLGLDDVALNGVSADASRIHFDSIAISGPTLLIHRDAGGAISLLGVKTRKPAAPAGGASASTSTSQSTTTQSTTAAASKPAPRLEIDKFIWHGVHVHLEDEGVTPPQTIGIDDVGVELTHLKLGLDPDDYAENTGKIKAWFAAPRFVDRFDLNGSVAPGPKALQLDFNGTGSGISPSALAPYLSPLGVQPLTTNGTLTFHAQVDVAHRAGTLNAGLAVDHIRYADKAQTLLAVDSLKVGNAALTSVPKGASNVAITDVVIDHPQARIERDADGKLIVAGIKLIEKPTTTTPTASPSTQPASVPPTPSAPLIVTLNALRIQNAGLSWSDRAVKPPVSTSLTGDIDLAHLTLGQPGAPADLHIVASIPQAIRRLDVTGQVSPAPAAQTAHLNVAAQGIVIGPLLQYLPPGINSTLQDGSLQLTLDAALAAVPKGGQSAKIAVTGLDYHDGATSLLKLGNLTLACSRLDPDGGVIAIDELSTAGIECDVTQLPEGKTRLLGLQIAPVSVPAQKAAANNKAPVDAASATVAVSAAEPTDTRNAAELVAAATKKLPLITIQKLNLNVHRLALIDGVNPAAVPLAIEDLRLTNKAPIEWLGRDPESHPATLLQLSSRLAPMADQLAVGIKISPFMLQPSVALDIAVTGIHGDGLTKLSPALQGRIDGSGMTNGQLAAHVEATLKLARRSPMDFDLSHPYGVEFVASNVQYRSAPDTPVLAGLDELRTEGVHVIPHTGDISVKSIELTNVALTAIRDTDGIHALGMVLKSQPPATQPTTESSKGPSTEADAKNKQSNKPQQTASGPTTKPSIPASEIKIDHIVASGMNLRIEDRTTKPITVIPLTGLDAEIRDLSSLALYEDKPFRFSALINAGKIGVPAHSGTGLEDRDLFSQLTASGKIGLYPEFNGWAKIALSGFDLAGINGEAATESIVLTQGAFDMDVALHFEPGNVIKVDSKAILTDMRLSEPDDGAIRRWLVLPVALNVAIAAIRDPDGSITLPLSFGMKDLQPEGIHGAVAGAVVRVLMVAVVSAPAKLLEAFTGGPKAAEPEKPLTLDFAPGVVLPESQDQAQLKLLAQRMIKEPELQLNVAHTFGSQEQQTINARANPSAEEAQNLAYGLRAHKLELSRLRAEVAGQAEAQLSLFDESNATASIDRLRSIDRELAITETALDRTYDILRPGAEKQADRRTRAVAIEIAKQRLAAIRELLRTAGVFDAQERVKLANPVLTPSATDRDSKIVIQPVKTKG